MNITHQKSAETTPLPSHVLLSVCIPTYNRATILNILVNKLLGLLTRNFGTNYEIVISDNHSADGTRALIEEKFKHIAQVRVVSPPQHYPTAEENLCFGVSMCTGTYVWTLGDDDSIDPETVPVLHGLLEQNQHDLLIFNSRSVSYYGHLLKKIRIPCLRPQLDISLFDFIRLTGFWFVVAGFSTTVFRRSFADTEQFKTIMNIGKIYSHVTWLINQFHDKRFAFINKPLVNYRENLTDIVRTDHWEKVANREGLFVGGIWSTGFLAQMDYLVDQGIMERSFLRDVVDRNLECRFYFFHEIIKHMLQSLAYDSETRARSITSAELTDFCAWLYEVDGENLYLISLFEGMVESIQKNGKPDQEQLTLASDIIHGRKTMAWYEHFHVYNVYGYSVFRHGQTWFAVRMGEFCAVSFLLENIDFDDFGNILFVRKSEAELLLILQAQPRRGFANEHVKRDHVPFVLKPLPTRIAVVYRNEGFAGLKKRIQWRLQRLFSR